MSYRIAKALDKFRSQINAAFPNRSKASDGWIGDTAHSARKSDHNPNDAGVVCAFDLTHDPKNGVDCNKIAAALLAVKDKRIKYLIWNKKITERDSQGLINHWVTYTGKNPHQKHLHISVKSDKADDTADWVFALANSQGANTVVGNCAALVDYVVKSGDTLSRILKDKQMSLTEFYVANGHTADTFDPDNIQVGEVFKVKA